MLWYEVTRPRFIPVKSIVVSGGPVDGFKFFGPFDTEVEAEAWATEWLDCDVWWVTTIDLPGGEGN